MTALLLRPVPRRIVERVANFGVELEIMGARGNGRGTDAAVAAFMRVFHERQLVAPSVFATAEPRVGEQPYLHGYHCQCETCIYTRSSPLMAAQTDPSVKVEMVSRILRSNLRSDCAELTGLCEAYNAAGEHSGWGPTPQEDCGDHIHVSSLGTDDGRGLEFERATQNAAIGLIEAFMSAMTEDSWHEVAGGGRGRIRAYNGGKFIKPADGSATLRQGSGWISQRGSTKCSTFEFRLWNTPAKGHGERIACHVAISVAITRWAYTQVLRERANVSQLSFREFNRILFENRQVVFDNIVAAMPGFLRRTAEPVFRQLVVQEPASPPPPRPTTPLDVVQPGEVRRPADYIEHCECRTCADYSRFLRSQRPLATTGR